MQNESATRRLPHSVSRTSARTLTGLALKVALGLSLLPNPFIGAKAAAQTAASLTNSIQLPADWRNVKDGVGGYPAGNMLEIAVRHTHSDKLEMFKWRSEFISMLNAQPGPLIEREWHSIAGIPENTGAGTWTGMTWWENQQKWQDMANTVFTSPVTANWLKTVDMTLIFVKPLDKQFQLSTLAQSGTQVLELGVLSLPGAGAEHPVAAEVYLDSLKRNGVEIYRFAIYPNLTGLVGPYAVAYNKTGPPVAKGESWFVYMAAFKSADERARLQSSTAVHQAFGKLEQAMVRDHSDIQVMERTTSQVCIKKATNECSLDPDTCRVGTMGSGDTLAASCGERPQPCETEYNVCSNLSPRTCSVIGGKRVDACGTVQR